MALTIGRQVKRDQDNIAGTDTGLGRFLPKIGQGEVLPTRDATIQCKIARSIVSDVVGIRA